LEVITLANHKSAAKRARQAQRKETINGQRKSAVRTSEKSLLKALAEKNTKALPERTLKRWQWPPEKVFSKMKQPLEKSAGFQHEFMLL
jgi:hypothetical protein